MDRFELSLVIVLIVAAILCTGGQIMVAKENEARVAARAEAWAAFCAGEPAQGAEDQPTDKGLLLAVWRVPEGDGNGD